MRATAIFVAIALAAGPAWAAQSKKQTAQPPLLDTTAAESLQPPPRPFPLPPEDLPKPPVSYTLEISPDGKTAVVRVDRLEVGSTLKTGIDACDKPSGDLVYTTDEVRLPGCIYHLPKGTYSFAVKGGLTRSK